MSIAALEHVNVTVSNPEKTAGFLHRIFGWKTRWFGPSMGGGTTYHVGNGASYLAVYSGGNSKERTGSNSEYLSGLNHIAVVVDDLDATEERVLSEGIVTHNHGDYEPGRRFYFHDGDGIEYEVVSYKSGFWTAMREIADAGIARK